MAYTTTIIPSLQVLANFDREKVKDIEKKLITALDSAGCSESRYRRFKTDQDHSTPLKYFEVRAIYRFFRTEIEDALQRCEDDRMLETLKIWMPMQEEDIYAFAQMQKESA